MSDDVLIILQQAINKEEERKAYYDEAAQRVCNPLAQQTFEFLAKEEGKHAVYARRFYEKMQAAKGWPDFAECGDECKLAAEDIKAVFSAALAHIEGDVVCDTELTRTYDLGMGFERESIEFYRSQLEGATDPNARLFYEALLKAERLHLQLLSRTQEYLDDTAQWYFNEEQWIVEG